MAAGDVVSGISALSQYGYMTMQPGADVEWIIHNIYFDQDVKLFFYDGSNSLIFDYVKQLGHRPWRVFHLTNSRHIRIQAQKVGTTLVGYDGVVSK